MAGMKVEEFVKKYNGVKVDFDKKYGYQCVDLFRQFVKEALGIPEHTGPCSTTGGAKDLFLDYPKMPLEKKYFERLKKRGTTIKDPETGQEIKTGPLKNLRFIDVSKEKGIGNEDTVDGNHMTDLGTAHFSKRLLKHIK